MDNFFLLEKRRKRLSIYFGVFVLLSFWTVEATFLLSTYVTKNIALIKSLETQANGVKNILENQLYYAQEIANNNVLLKSVIEKGLEGTTIVEDGKKVLGELDPNFFEGGNTIFNGKEHKYLVVNFQSGKKYSIIIEKYNEYSYYKLIATFGYFILFSFPFFIMFYLLGYFFVGKNFRPIHETISSLESFSANINHELKTPLTEIISTLSLAQKLKVNYETAIEKSLYSALKINKLLDSILGIINLVDSSYKKERLNLIEELNSALVEYQQMYNNKEIQIDKTFRNRSYMCSMNKEHFHICVGNLLKNAIKYSPQLSSIHVFFHNGKLTIQDFGIGIESSNLKNIFHQYFRENYLREEGFGLGLSLVKKISDLHGWEIEIESEKGKGTKVSINFATAGKK